MFMFSRMKSDVTATPPTTSVRAARPGTMDPAIEAEAADISDEAEPHLRALGLSPGASWEEVSRAHASLVADLTPGPGASHRNVALAKALLDEVNSAYASLRLLSVA